MASSKKQMLQEISQLSFALTDAVLFLDTHPDDKDALTYYHKLLHRKKMLYNEYSALYGPLDNQSVTSKNQWTWINDPWPWEGEGN